MRGGTDFVLFETDNTTEEHIEYGSLSLIIDTTYRPQENARNYGEVVQVPFQLSKTVIGQLPQGVPKTVDGIEFIFLKDIPQVVQPGDKIYFHYNTLGDKHVRYEPQPDIYGVRYDQIYCCVRDGEIHAVGQWVLSEPVEESWADITTASGLIVKSAPGKHFRIGKVTHLPELMKGQHEDAKPGDFVLMRNNADLTVTIEGKEFYVCNQKHLEAKGPLEELKKVKL